MNAGGSSFFVSWLDGKPEFRVADGHKMRRAIKEHLCWICGVKLLPNRHTFVTGPTATISHLNPEPPCHQECAEFSVKACPFLSRPKSVRREAGVREDAIIVGHAIMDNPGVSLLWECRGYELTQATNGILFSMPNPRRFSWWSEGRAANRQEVAQAIEKSIEHARSVADINDPVLAAAIEAAWRMVPAK